MMTRYLPWLAIAVAVSVFALYFVLPPTAEITLKAVAMVLSLVIAIGLLWKGGKAGDGGEMAGDRSGQIRPAVSREARGSAEAEVVAFVARLQEKGRLIDFLMEDISRHDDKMVGSVARVVHQGCRAVVDEHFKIEPVESGAEGSRVTIREGYDASLYRLTGNLSGKAPFAGTLVHKGWKVTSAHLPKVVTAGSGKLPALAPAQVEV